MPKMQLLPLRLLLAVVASVAASSSGGSGGSAVGGHGSSLYSDEDCPTSNMAIFILASRLLRIRWHGSVLSLQRTMQPEATLAR